MNEYPISNPKKEKDTKIIHNITYNNLFPTNFIDKIIQYYTLQTRVIVWTQ